MARDFVINGETMISVKGGAHHSGGVLGKSTQLGLAEEYVRISPVFRHKDINVDDFGPEIPAEVLVLLQEIRIRAVLLHYDVNVLNGCMNDAMGIGPQSRPNPFGGGNPIVFNPRGLIGPAGLPLGHGLPLFSSGNFYVSLNLASPILNQPWRFPSTYLTYPLAIPLGTSPSPVEVEFRAIPYVPLLTSGGSLSSGGVVINGVTWTPGEISSSGVQIWDQNVDS